MPLRYGTEILKLSEQLHVFMKRKSTTDGMFALRVSMEKYREGQKEFQCVRGSRESI